MGSGCAGLGIDMTEKESHKSTRDDYDSPWKEALEHYFPEFLALLFPAIHAGIDWSHPHEFLDKELAQVVRDAALGRRYADKLVKVWTLAGKERWLLIHVEVQGQPEPGFDERMYVYNYRLFDRYRVDIVSLAVLADLLPDFQAGNYRRDCWGCHVRFSFPTVKLLELGRDWASLEKSDNPFTLVVMAHLMAQENREGEKRIDAKLQLIRLMYRRGYSKERILTLFRVIDWLLYIPPELAPAFQQVLSTIESKKMAYITSIKRLGLERGMQQGMQQGEAAVLRRQLQRKFGGEFTDAHRQRVDRADVDTLLDWSEQVLSAKFIDEVFH
uniref:DUF4351 domain-containing protein n=1 Tax=Candidatus Kentrum sp. LPFa TaxID=2126335 RepID=A0A450X2J7_9GAMM|nr:MAG: hypothetical protein BECKLPF1236A_GA0070988_103804 [Candidatus Kentron sp. LPFa]VFK35341.1 MAG: hypothetical protein BECKLPF1236C_GA0070990_103624 [Candidatus Kentron sp. LPFa]